MCDSSSVLYTFLTLSLGLILFFDSLDGLACFKLCFDGLFPQGGDT